MSRLRKIKNDSEKIITSKYYLLSSPKITKKSNHLEIGMGKGNFLISMAENNKNINFYGIDKFATVILKAINKLKLLDKTLSNLYFLQLNASDLLKIFPKNFFDVIYLNFNDPWPKKRHEKRRLISNFYLPIYKQLLSPKGIIKFKTDNENYYKYSLELLRLNKDVVIEYYTDNFYKDKNPNNFVLTEYESKFINLNVPIKCIHFKYK